MGLEALAAEALGIVGKRGRRNPQASQEAAQGLAAVLRVEGHRVDARKLRYARRRLQGRNGAQGENVVDFGEPVSQRRGRGRVTRLERAERRRGKRERARKGEHGGHHLLQVPVVRLSVAGPNPSDAATPVGRLPWVPQKGTPGVGEGR